jgi:hypothetical protein
MIPEEDCEPPLDEEVRLLMDAVFALRSFCLSDPKSRRRGRVDAIWRAIAAGILVDKDAALWAKIVATDVVKNVIDKKDNAEDRPKRALAALKLSGREERHYSDLMALQGFLAIRRIPSLLCGTYHAPESPAELAKTLKEQGYFKGLSDRQAADVIRKWRAENS